MEERPLSCSGCKKETSVRYREIVDGEVVETSMCATCPVLKCRLHGSPVTPMGSPAEAGLCCASCLTSLTELQSGSDLGCVECYNLFSDLLVEELILAHCLPSNLVQAWYRSKNTVFHVGWTPHAQGASEPANRVVALSEELNEAIKKENYERAAALRDQLKSLMEGVDGNQK